MTNEECIRILKVAIDSSREHISFCFDEKGIKALDLAIKALEQTRWIPVSERLPERNKAVLVWCPEYKNIYCAYCNSYGDWEIFGGTHMYTETPIAWRLLPPGPYKAESEEV